MSSSPPVRRSKRLLKQGPEEMIVPLEKIGEIFKDPNQMSSTRRVNKSKENVKNVKASSTTTTTSVSKKILSPKKTIEDLPKENVESTTAMTTKTRPSKTPSPSSATEIISKTTATATTTPVTTHTNNNNNSNTHPRKILKQVEIDQNYLPPPTMSAADKQRVVIKKTPSMKDTFPGRLEWKQRHYDKPVTSTPVASSKTTPPPTTEQNDVDLCFGFDDPDEEEILDYSTLISPIPKERVQVEQGPNIILFKRIPDPPRAEPAPTVSPEEKFNHLLHRYHKDEEEEEENDGEVLHVKHEDHRATYSNPHHKQQHLLTTLKKSDRATTKAKSTKRTKKVKDSAAGLSKKGTKKKEEKDEEFEKWLEEKNKEFQEIEKVPLVVEKSF